MGYNWLKWVTPNQLTMGRIFAVPVLMLLVYVDKPLVNFFSLALFSLAGLTDYVDGNLARYRGEVTQLGRMLDPIADKMLVSACLIMLVATGHANVVPTILIIMREFAVSGLRQVSALEGVEIHVGSGAKWKTGLQMGATAMLLLNHDPFGIPMEMGGRILLWVAMAITLWTGYSYFTEFFRHFKDHSKPESKRPARKKSAPKKGGQPELSGD